MKLESNSAPTVGIVLAAANPPRLQKKTHFSIEARLVRKYGIHLTR
jgi:hypothetical protein